MSPKVYAKVTRPCLVKGLAQEKKYCSYVPGQESVNWGKSHEVGRVIHVSTLGGSTVNLTSFKMGIPLHLEYSSVSGSVLATGKTRNQKPETKRTETADLANSLRGSCKLCTRKSIMAS